MELVGIRPPQAAEIEPIARAEQCCTASASSTPESIAPPRIGNAENRSSRACLACRIGIPYRASSAPFEQMDGRLPTMLQGSIGGRRGATGAVCYKASLIGSAQSVSNWTDAGLSWRIAGRSGRVELRGYLRRETVLSPGVDAAAAVSRRYRQRQRGRIAILSTTWQTATLVARRDISIATSSSNCIAGCRVAGSRAVLVGGLGPKTYIAALALLAVLAVAMAGAVVCARLLTSEWSGALFPGRFRCAVRLADRRLHHPPTGRGATASIDCPTRCCRSRPQSSAMKRDFVRASAHGMVLRSDVVTGSRDVEDRSLRMPSDDEIAAINARHLIETPLQPADLLFVVGTRVDVRRAGRRRGPPLAATGLPAGRS